MLAAKLALAIAPAARGEDAREALFYSTRVAGDRRPKTVADHAHPQRIDARLLGQPVQRVLRIGDLIVAQDIPALTFALAASAKVEAENDIAPVRQHRSHQFGMAVILGTDETRSEEHTSELQSLMRISYAVFCLKKKK